MGSAHTGTALSSFFIDVHPEVCFTAASQSNPIYTAMLPFVAELLGQFSRLPLD